jgi:hypothetical protein
METMGDESGFIDADENNPVMQPNNEVFKK